MTPRPISRAKMLVMCLATGGMWSILWFYRALETIKLTTQGLTIRPALQTARFAALPVTIALGVIVGRIFQTYPWGWAEHPRRVSALWVAVLIALIITISAVQELVGPQLSRLRETAGGLIYIRNAAAMAIVTALLWLGWLLPNPFRFLGLATVLPLLTIQMAINQYLDNLDIHAPEESHFTAFEILLAVICGSFLLWVMGGAVVAFVESFDPTSAPPGA